MSKNENQGGSLMDRLQAEMQQGDVDGTPLTQAQVAREIGVSGSAISQYTMGKYPGDSAALEEKIRKWVIGRDKQRRVVQGMPKVPEYFESPSALKMEHCIEYAHRSGTIAVIYGGAGVGKTTTARRYAENNTAVWLATMTPACSSIASCLDRVANAVGLKGLPPHSAPAKLEGAIMDRVMSTKGLILIDEAQHLSVKALEALRSIHDATDIGIVLLGNEVIYTRLTGGTRATEFAQLFSRIGARVRLTRPTKGDVKTLCDAWRIQGDDERTLVTELSQRPGALRGVTKALQLAKLLAGAATLEREHILRAWSELGGEV